MAKQITITISDFIYEDIFKMMQREDKQNRSEYVEEIIRLGIQERKLQLENDKGDE